MCRWMITSQKMTQHSPFSVDEEEKT